MTTPRLLPSNLSEPARYRLGVASRVLAAIVGGYALAVAIKLLLTLTAPVAPAGQFANLLIYAIHTGILMWAFHTSSVTRVWVWLLGWTAMVYVICWLLIQKGGAA